MRKFVMSDMHGHEFAARALLNYANVQLPQDELRFLGDYIDRGPNSFGCIRLVRQLQYEGAKVHMGNHELMLLMWAADRLSTQSYYQNGGEATIKSFEKANLSDTWFQDTLQWISTLKIADEDNTFFYAHAGVNPEHEEQTNDDFLWVREEFLEADKEAIRNISHNKIVVHGHTPMQEVCYDGARINTDLGAGGRKKLALVELTEGVVYTYDFEQARLNGKEYAITKTPINNKTPVSIY